MRKCKKKGCNEVHKARGFCSNHYEQWRNKEIREGGHQIYRKHSGVIKIPIEDILPEKREMVLAQQKVLDTLRAQRNQEID